MQTGRSNGRQWPHATVEYSLVYSESCHNSIKPELSIKMLSIPRYLEMDNGSFIIDVTPVLKKRQGITPTWL